MITTKCYFTKIKIKTLKYFQFACVLIAIIRFMIYPVVFASYMASGLSRNFTGIDSEEIEILGNVTTPEQNFVFGMISGFTLEFATALSIGGKSFLLDNWFYICISKNFLVESLKYLLVHRLWEYAKATEASSSSRYVIP